MRTLVIWWQRKQSTPALIGSSGKRLWTFTKLRFITQACFLINAAFNHRSCSAVSTLGRWLPCCPPLFWFVFFLICNYLGHHKFSWDHSPNFDLELFQTIFLLMCFSAVFSHPQVWRHMFVSFFLQESKGCAWSFLTSPWMRITFTSSGEKVPHVSNNHKRSNGPPPHRSLTRCFSLRFSSSWILRCSQLKYS